MTDSYETARRIIDAAPEAQFDLPKYTGGIGDLAYLRGWVLNQVTQIYDVDAAVFDNATLLSTTILRDFVHRAIYQTTEVNNISAIRHTSAYLGADDVALAFRYPAFGLCGLLSAQQLAVFRSFGYDANTISSIEDNPDNYDDSHVMTQVYLTDLGRFIVQDSTFNCVYRDESDNILDFYGVRQAIYGNNETVRLDMSEYYRDYYRYEVPADGPRPQLQEWIVERYFRNIFSWRDDDAQTTFALRDITRPSRLTR